VTARDRNSAISPEFRFTSSDGLLIACARWSNRGPLRGIVQIAHGMGEHIGRYGETIDALTSAGLIVYGNDHRGHGRTALPTGDFGDFGPGGFDLLVEDMVLLSHHIAKHERPNTPFFLLGHGLGSFAAQQFVLDHSRNIDGLILSGSSVLDGLARLARSAPAIGDLLNFDFDPARTPFDWLSRDDAVVDAFLDDPLCFAELKPAAFASFLAAASRLSDPAALGRIRRDLSVYLFSGSEDPVGQHLEGVQALIEGYREAGLDDISHDFYAGGRHEMLNEINREEVRARLLRWISRVLERSWVITAAASDAR
jgi:alpha-beta hydrolase superfamily lysophospholipase